MDAGDLTVEQLEQLAEQISQAFRYIQVLNDRIQQRGFPYDDKLRQDVTHAWDALHSLWVTVHYLKCNRSAGRQPKQKPKTATAFRIDVVISKNAPMRPIDQWQFVEAETPLEALAKLARRGRLSPIDSFWARIALSVDDDGVPQKIASVPLTRELTMPMPEADPNWPDKSRIRPQGCFSHSTRRT